MKIQDLKELIKAIDESSIDELKLEEDGKKIVIRKNTATFSTPSYLQAPLVNEEVRIVEQPKENKAPTESKEAEEPQLQLNREGLKTINSPMVGTFYAAPSPDSPPYVKVGDEIGEETIVCIVEAMKLMNELEAEVKGKIVEVLVENGQLVEYGQPLFLVQPK